MVCVEATTKALFTLLPASITRSQYERASVSLYEQTGSRYQFEDGESQEPGKDLQGNACL